MTCGMQPTIPITHTHLCSACCMTYNIKVKQYFPFCLNYSLTTSPSGHSVISLRPRLKGFLMLQMGYSFLDQARCVPAELLVLVTACPERTAVMCSVCIIEPHQYCSAAIETCCQTIFAVKSILLQTFHLPFVPFLSVYSHILLLETFMHLTDSSKCCFIFSFDKLLKWFSWWKDAALVRKILSIIMFSFFNLLNINVHFIFCMICFGFTCLYIFGFICLVWFCIIIFKSCFCAALVEKCFSFSLTALTVKI